MNTTTIPPTQSDFPSRLEAIRLVARQRRAHRDARVTEADRLRSQLRVEGLEFVDRVERQLVLLLDDIVGELPAPATRTHRFFDGRFLIGSRWDELAVAADGAATRHFSRVELLLEPLADERRFRLEWRATVRGRDLPSELVTVDLTDGGLAELAAFTEQHLLRFARAYFDGGHLARRAS